MIKKRPRKRAYPSFVAALAVALSVASTLPASLRAQALSSVLPVEPPSSLFSTRLGDDDVEVLVQGFWEASVLTTGTFSSVAGVVGYSPVPLLFTQTPDLYAFLCFRKKWIFEAYVTKELTDNRFTLSFEGDDDDVVRFARLGNSGISMPDYPFLAFGAPAASPGLALSAHDPDAGWSFDAMLRWDGLAWKERRLSGGVEAVETTLSPRDQVRGRRFVLPGAPVSALALVDRSSSGTRALAADEYGASLGTGLVLLSAEPKGELRASYVDAAGASRELTLYTVGTGSDGKIVRQGSDHELRNLYALPASDAPRRLFVRNLASGQPDLRYEVEEAAAGLVLVRRADWNGGYGDDAYRRPFIIDASWYYEAATGAPYASGEAFQILALSMATAEGPIRLEPRTVPGTITVRRDGAATTAFSYDAAAQTLSLTPPPGIGELIELRYAVASDDSGDGALAYGVGARFSWLGLEWAAALGGRQPLFGVAYDEAGRQRSSWLGLSLGASFSRTELQKESLQKESLEPGADKSAQAAVVPFSFSAATGLRLSRAGAAGPYRILGMEDYASRKPIAAFRPVADAGLSVESAADEGLAAEPAFAAAIASLHAAGESNRVLRIGAGPAATGGKARLVRYVEAAPLDSYGLLSFYLKAEDVPAEARLTLSVGDGEGRGAEIRLPLAALGPGWRRVELVLSPTATTRIVGGDGSTVLVAGVSASYAAGAQSGLVELTIESLGSGAVLLDELCLDDARDGLAALGQLSFALGDERGLRGPYLSGSGSGLVDQGAAASARISAGWVDRLFDLSAHWTPSYASESPASGAGDRLDMGIGYLAAIPGRRAPTRLVDGFSWNGGAGRYGKELEAALGLGPVSASAAVNAQEEPGAFHQGWAASLAYAGRLSLSANARLDAPTAGAASLGAALDPGTPASWGSSWLKAWRLAAPASEAEAYARRLEARAALFGSTLSASARRLHESSGWPSSRAEAKILVPLRLGVVSLSPYYARATMVERASLSQSFLGDAEAYASDAALAAGLWAAPPLAELWDEGAFDSFQGLASGARKAEHRAELGLGLSRPLGYGPIDLILPSSLEASLARVAASSGAALVHSRVLSLSLVGGGAKLYGASGYRPLWPAVAFDEYSHRTTLALTAYASDGAILPRISSTVAAGIEGSGGWAIALTNDLTYALSRATVSWSEAAGAALTLRPARSWLGAILDLVSSLRLGGRMASQAGEGAPEGEPEASWVSDWLDTTLAARPTYLERIDLKLGLGQPSGLDTPMAVRVSCDYSTRVSLAGALSFGLGAGLWQTASLGTAPAPWSFGYRLSIEAKVVF